MRIIAGEHKKRKLYSPRIHSLRPTSDRFRENIFNILTGYFENANILDLFAGVGTLGLEALSRGAKEVTFVDDSLQALQYLRRNTDFCRNQVHIIPSKVETAIKTLYKKNRFFDVIFVDPPYDQGLINPTLEQLDEFPVMSPSCIIVVQHSKREEIRNAWQNFSIFDMRKYGDTFITFLRHSEGAKRPKNG